MEIFVHFFYQLLKYYRKIPHLRLFAFSSHPQHYFYHFDHHGKQSQAIPRHKVTAFLVGNGDADHGYDCYEDEEAVEDVADEEVFADFAFVSFLFRVFEAFEYVFIVVKRRLKHCVWVGMRLY